ncbi:methyltransferase [Altererythrobacter aurantiacus]|uniref:Ribosomal protein L11 methyltransferase n=1 Tax=Parapontixanthobacter aurantiacus TaxID=1463599 RepID=A0A844ZDY9_9SPHN|nr:50S ribosomal protein L11 methyltransferase [Parapontixanthobacter aurantiacus]MXO85463.1 methyltransferase [Parapontixanthobacter aurantiacus]
MADSWKVAGQAGKRDVQAALLAHDAIDDWDGEIVVLGREIAEDRPNDWVLEAYLSRRPTKRDLTDIASLFTADPPDFSVEKLPEEDWLTLSQGGVQPVTAGRFYVHTPDYPPADDGELIDLVVPASQAFGTGSHATTAGCLAMLSEMRRTGVLARNIVDVGSGTGLLAFAARALWPRAYLTASDIDEVCRGVMINNARLNEVPIGPSRGQLTVVIAAGMEDPLIEVRGPYDLLIANILAQPLVALADDFAANIAPGGNVLLAGLLEEQEATVRAAYRRAGFRLARRLVKGDWAILWLRKRR